MRGGAKRLVAIGLLTLCCVFPATERAHAQTAGITVTPAMLTLDLAAGSSTQSDSLTVANRYAAPVTLNFAFERRLGQTGGADPSTYLHISQTEAMIGQSEAIRQTITATDSEQLSPGSQLADLVITQIATAQSNVGVQASIRVPLTIVKEDGAVTALKLAAFSAPKPTINLPGVLDATIQNSGNVVAIPHGTITITAPGGAVVKQGVLNVESRAVSPGGKILLNAKLVSLRTPIWPGMYKATVSYGLGGGQMTTMASKKFVYIAWWHLIVLAGLMAGWYFAATRMPAKLKQQHKPPAHHPPRPKPKRVLVGRNA